MFFNSIFKTVELRTSSNSSEASNQRLSKKTSDKVQRIGSVRNLERRGQTELIDEILELPWGVFSKEKPNVARARAILQGFIVKTSFGYAIKRLAEYAILHSKDPMIRLTHLDISGTEPLVYNIITNLMSDLLRRSIQNIRVTEESTQTEVMDSLVNALRMAKCCNPVIVVDLNDVVENKKALRMVAKLWKESHKTFPDRHTGVEIDLSNVLFVFVGRWNKGTVRVSEADIVGLVKTAVLPPLLAKHRLQNLRHLFTDSVLRMIVGKARGLNSKDSELRGQICSRFVELSEFEELLKSLVTFLKKNRNISHPSAVVEFLKKQRCVKHSCGVEFSKPLEKTRYLPVGCATVLDVYESYGHGLIQTVYAIFSKELVTQTEEERQIADIAYNYCRSNASRYGISAAVLENPFRCSPTEDSGQIQL